jgi:hypothetical protein
MAAEVTPSSSPIKQQDIAACDNAIKNLGKGTADVAKLSTNDLRGRLVTFISNLKSLDPQKASRLTKEVDHTQNLETTTQQIQLIGLAAAVRLYWERNKDKFVKQMKQQQEKLNLAQKAAPETGFFALIKNILTPSAKVIQPKEEEAKPEVQKEILQKAPLKPPRPAWTFRATVPELALDMIKLLRALEENKDPKKIEKMKTSFWNYFAQLLNKLKTTDDDNRKRDVLRHQVVNYGKYLDNPTKKNIDLMCLDFAKLFLPPPTPKKKLI